MSRSEALRPRPAIENNRDIRNGDCQWRHFGDEWSGIEDVEAPWLQHCALILGLRCEGLPLTLVEKMLRSCVPIGTCVFDNPDVGLDELRRNESHAVAPLLQLTCPIVRSSTGLHAISVLMGTRFTSASNHLPRAYLPRHCTRS